MALLNHVTGITIVIAALLPSAAFANPPTAKPNVLFIAMDDLNDWTGCMGGHPQAKTPNLDRLAASGMLFTNAHCPAPSCNPSRTAILTGISPNTSGLLTNRQKMREVLPDAELLPRSFSRHGYWSAGAGKMLHYVIDAPSWDDYFPAKESENPLPFTRYPEKRPVSLPVGGPWQYIETDWAPLDVTDEEFGGDWLVSKWVGEQLSREHDEPFFLACGIYRPHEPWFVPRKYFEAFPLDEIQLPPGYREDDLADVPPAGQKLGRNRYFAHIRKHDQWKQAIQSYLASIAFADAMLGRVLQALDDGPNRDNTVVVLWSDHGWHLGEKEHWQKFTGWRTCTRVPLIMRVPEKTPGLAAGTSAGAVCTKPVNLVSLAPTLLDVAGLPASSAHEGPSLVPLLRDPNAAWEHVAVTYLDKPGTYAVSTEDWRLIHYADGEEELYHTPEDPYEWTNLAGKPEHQDRLATLRGYAPNDPPKTTALLPTDSGYRGIWYMIKAKGKDVGQPYKYSGGMATYPQQHAPIAIYAPKVDKTFFVYGGVAEERKSLLHMVGFFDHASGTFSKPRILLDKQTDDAHDNPVLSIDDDGHLWIFSASHGVQRPSFIHRSVRPYDITEFERVQESNFSYAQPWHLSGEGFLFLHTKYANGRGLSWSTSADGRTWSDTRKVAHIAKGDYQVSWVRGDRVATAFDYHPEPLGLDARTNIYYLETRGLGGRWTTIRGELVEPPLTKPKNPALVRDYQAEGKLVYLKDLNSTPEGHPVILFLTSTGANPGPENGPYQWHTACWTGTAWEFRPMTTSDHNYDHGSLIIEADGTWKVIAPTDPGPQPFGTGGQMVLWTSSDRGQTWNRVKQLTHDTTRNHSYARRPLNAHPDFAALWADGNAFKPSGSSLYFTDNQGKAVYRLPMKTPTDATPPEKVW